METEVAYMYADPIAMNNLRKGDIVEFTHDYSNVIGLVIRKERTNVRILSMLINSKENHSVIDINIDDPAISFTKINQMTEIDTEVYNNKYNPLAPFQSFMINLNNTRHLNF